MSKRTTDQSGLMARVIRTAAMRKGMTIELLAMQLERKPSSISSAINGNPTLSNLKEIAEACDLRIALVSDKSVFYI